MLFLGEASYTAIEQQLSSITISKARIVSNTPFSTKWKAVDKLMKSIR
jgi:hypothetical protein